MVPNNRQAVTFSPDLWEMIGQAAAIEGIPPTIWVRAQIILLLRKAGVAVTPTLTPTQTLLGTEPSTKGAPF